LIEIKARLGSARKMPRICRDPEMDKQATLLPADAQYGGAHSVGDCADCVHCHIRMLSVCGVFASNELEHVQRLVSHRHIERGGQLFEENQPASLAYTLAEGAMRLYKLLPDGRRQVVGFALPGDFLGLAASGKYSYTAEAIAPSQACRFKRSELGDLFGRFPKMERRLLAMANAELNAAQEQMVLLGRKSPVEKVASFLLGLSKRLERLGQTGPIFTLPMARADIADFLGLTVETVSRTFTKLKAAHAICLPTPERVHFINPRLLEALATGEVTL
jgi:CRP/FNR family transcriptional regulator